MFQASHHTRHEIRDTNVYLQALPLSDLPNANNRVVSNDYHLASHDTIPILCQWDQSVGLTHKVHTNPGTTLQRFRACRIHPMHSVLFCRRVKVQLPPRLYSVLHLGTNFPQCFCGNSGGKVSPVWKCVVVPARQTYSHSASVGSR